MILSTKGNSKKTPVSTLEQPEPEEILKEIPQESQSVHLDPLEIPKEIPLESEEIPLEPKEPEGNDPVPMANPYASNSEANPEGNAEEPLKEPLEEPLKEPLSESPKDSPKKKSGIFSSSLKKVGGVFGGIFSTIKKPFGVFNRKSPPILNSLSDTEADLLAGKDDLVIVDDSVLSDYDRDNQPRDPHEEFVNIEIAKEEVRIDYNKMTDFIKRTHPKNNFGMNYKVPEITFDMKSGAHMCLITSQYSAFDDFGVAISLYFRFLKYLAVCFAILGVISSPMIYFNSQCTLSFPSIIQPLPSTKTSIQRKVSRTPFSQQQSEHLPLVT